MTVAITPTPDFLTNLEAQIEAAATKFENEIVAVADAIGPSLLQGAETIIEDLGELAMTSVLQQAPAVISGTEKFGNAVDNVVQTVETRGQAITQMDAQVAVQSAFDKAQQVIAAKAPPAAA